MGSWEYRVLEHKSPLGAKYSVHEVYTLGDDEQPTGHEGRVLQMSGDCMLNLRWLVEVTNRALRKPVLSANDFPVPVEVVEKKEVLVSAHFKMDGWRTEDVIWNDGSVSRGVLRYKCLLATKIEVGVYAISQLRHGASVESEFLMNLDDRLELWSLMQLPWPEKQHL